VWKETATLRGPPEEAILILAPQDACCPRLMVPAAARHAKAWTPKEVRVEA
jgi:hypothetical protein